MLLGGIRYLLPVIKTAHELGCYVITADYLPDNIAHRYSDEYVNVSIIDKEAVLKVAKKKKIDGIMSFGVDPGVVTAAYVAERMGLPFKCSYWAASVLQNKVSFRKFLLDNGFNCPCAKGYSSAKEALADIEELVWPVIVKPVDAAGSKGVTKVTSGSELQLALENAFSNSISRQVIIEDYLEVSGNQSSVDIFTIDGKVSYPMFSDQFFDNIADNPYVPTIEIWPSTMPEGFRKDIIMQLNRLFGLLKCGDGLWNVESRVCIDGKAYIMEVSPRGGGNHIALLQDMAYRTNYLENEIKAALGMPIELKTPCEPDEVWGIYSIHPQKHQCGTIKEVRFEENALHDNVRFVDLPITPGTEVQPLTGANMVLGDVFLHFNNRPDILKAVEEPSMWFNINFT